MKLFRKKWFWGLVGTLLGLHVVLVITDHDYLYKGVWNTYLKGRTKPAIDEYKIFYNREVKAGTHQPWAEHKDYNRREIREELIRQMEEYKTVAYLVIHNDSILYERYWDIGAQNSVTNSFSIAKTICSILTGIAIKEGKIKSVEQPVGDFLPEYKEGERAKIKIKHLLTMSSGIGFTESYSSPFAFTAKGYYGDDLRHLLMKYEPKTEPGKIFDYQSGVSQLLGFVLEAATGMTISEYASEKLWKPIGAKNSAWWSMDHKDGQEKVYCCFNSNVRDFARIGRLYLNKGNWNGNQLVPVDYVATSVKAANLLEKSGEPNSRYGYSWWLYEHKGHYCYYARGMLGQYVFVIPDENLIVVRLGHQRADNTKANPPADVFTWLDAALELVGQ